MKSVFSKLVCALILIERAIKKEQKEFEDKQAKQERNNPMQTTRFGETVYWNCLNYGCDTKLKLRMLVNIS